MAPSFNRAKYHFLKNTKDIWEAVAKKYSQQDDMARIYQMHCEIANLQQGKMTVEEYFGILRHMHEELISILNPQLMTLKKLSSETSQHAYVLTLNFKAHKF
ncbi:hypothetical protein AMTR_s00038p00175990 [Amborella trichopoda]|uniref:Retrotransposon gag domain-containing protein n=1 Tax=Amborella trichopoda TaxID=13333 RepID=U5D2Q0_AMBTC|nr:hypothetical protein AMTR_s00038p00175990 [Amborella trichopoda]